eukprot:7224896-Lingulodinium_polyedra.AAC.1
MTVVSETVEQSTVALAARIARLPENPHAALVAAAKDDGAGATIALCIVEDRGWAVESHRHPSPGLGLAQGRGGRGGAATALVAWLGSFGGLL